MGKSVIEQRLLEYPDVFADVYNGFYFGGITVLSEESLEAMPGSAYTRDMEGEIRGRMRDVRKKCRISGGDYQVICQVENQTDIDNTMPVRVMGYEYAAYEEQIDQIRDENKKNKRDAGSRKLFASQKLTPVMSLVLYFGEGRWRKPKRLHDMLRWPENVPERVRQYVPDYPIKVIEVAHLREEERRCLKSDFRIVAEYLACHGNMEKWEEFLKGNHPIRHVEALLDVLGELMRDDLYYELLDSIREKKRTEEEWNMCKIAQELHRRGMEEGMEQGMQVSMQIMKAIRENIRAGQERNFALESISARFEISEETAGQYYDLVAGN